MNVPLNAVVVGVGSLGQHHARIFSQNNKTNLLAVVDTDHETGASVAKQWKTQHFASLDDISDKIDLASVVVPTESHYKIASWFLERGIPVLVEKPITKTVKEGEALIDLAQNNGAILQVGHIERFNPGVMVLGEHLTVPLFIESHRLGPPAPRVKDVGVVLDLMIHDLDLILSLVKSEVDFIDAAGVPIISPQEDIANARIRFKSGCVANVTVSRITPEKQRKIRFFQKDTYLSLDYLKPALHVYKKKPGKDGTVDIDFSKPKLSKHEPLAAEIDSFIECVIHNRQPIVTGEDGVRALRLADTITQQVQAVTAKLIESGQVG